LRERGVDEREHHLPSALAGVSEGVTHEMHAATPTRCLEIFAIAAMSPECESEMTSLKPRKPRRVSERKKSVQNGSA